MAVGCIPVLPEHGGVAEFAVHKKNALIVDTMNIENTAVQMVDLLENPQRMHSMRREEIDTVRCYSVMNAAW